MTGQKTNQSQSVVKPRSRADSPIPMAEVEKFLRRFFAKKIEQAEALDPHYAELLSQIDRLLARGGKRIRPRLVLESYTAYGGKNSEAIIKIAASQELFHAFVLIHDDIIDRDTIRWSGPNISGKYEKEFSEYLKPEDARHFADSWALMAGDICCNLSLELLADSGFSAAQTMRALRLAQQTLFTVVGGEIMDVATSIHTLPDEALDDEHFRQLYGAKTSAYSFSAPLRMGAMLAGAGAVQDRRLQQFGYHIGIAFQVRDDILGIFGDETRLGKPVLSDIREGKRTLLMSYALNLANQSQHKRLKAILGNPRADKDDLAKVQSIVRSSGALEKAESFMQKHCREAHNIVLSGGMPMDLSGYLSDLVSFCAKRIR